MTDISLLDIFDPRGRADRKGLILAAAVLMGAQAGFVGGAQFTGYAVPMSVSLPVQLVFAWLGIVAVSKRMHDLGLGLNRVWWGLAAMVGGSVVTAVVVVALFNEDALLPGNAGYLAVAASVFAPAIAATFWLHFAPGQVHANRFGPVPGASGFSPAHRKLRRSNTVAASQVDAANVAVS